MDTNRHKYLTLFLSTLQISTFTFGGGFVIIPLMRRKFSTKLKWIDEEEMLDLTAIAQSSPGPVAVNASILIGYKTGGIPGALVSILGTIIPPFVIISIISAFYAAFRDNVYVTMAMSGTTAGVAAVIADVVISMSLDLIKKKSMLAIAMLAISFILLEFFSLNIILLILLAGLTGYISCVIRRRKIA